MSQDLLAAIGSRLEAQLKSREVRIRSIEDAVKARVSANPPAPFTLLADDATSADYTPAAAPVSANTEAVANTSSADLLPEIMMQEPPLRAEDIAAAIAPFAALFSAPAQILIETPAPDTVATVAENTMPSVAVPAVAPEYVPVLKSSAASTNTVVGDSDASTPVASTTVASTTASTVATSASIASTAGVNTVVTNAASTRTNSERSDAVPTPVATDDAPVVTNFFPNTTPPVSADFGVGATFRRGGVLSDTPMTVTRTGNGVVFATFTDSEGTREMAFTPSQLDLVTSAPG